MNTIYKQLPFIKGFTISVGFSFILLLIRIIKTDSIYYLFLVWNLFLACIPYLVTFLLGIKTTNRFVFWLGFTIWLAFLPNAPYILTDLQHIRISTLQTIWFDVLLILSFAINGMIIGFVSLQMMQKLLQVQFSKLKTHIIINATLLLCGFGIYLGRVLRWNSWDILQNPLAILSDIFKRVLFPIEHINTWAFTIGFGSFLIITYRLIQYCQENK
ncbi:DUF1361 domain-containing protein [Aquimarina sp. AD10]|uniref:DUF1361 domain-containing protein n=1 Tax=Aquimarina sp. AD10 TaxID=1714849 RepID=UPI000E4B42B6|nr:DUF1361 domain-containing protein [Aquimarina sp. AD10]AXT60738.1 DUF1361 domain-containing protein [Aquimarina sp. AD10]RKM95765.1 DUF1361 domain-containing protein [Aquimarina sp. AD10]